MKIITRLAIPAVLAVSASSIAATDSRATMALKMSILKSQTKQQTITVRDNKKSTLSNCILNKVSY